MNGLQADSAFGAMPAIIVCLLICLVFLLLFFQKRIKQIQWQADSDRVTGGFNANGFSKAAENLMAGENRLYTLVVMEVRNFHKIYRTFGSAKSNNLLAYLQTVLTSALTGSEPVGRIGSGTFCFLLKNVQENEVRARLTRIYESANQFNRQRRDPYPLDLRFGIYIPAKIGESLSDMQEKALFVAETSTDASRYVFHKDDSTQMHNQKELLIKQVEQSLKNNDFILFLQPKVRLGDNRIVGAEALVRWRHPRRGLLTPEQFVPQLEELHTIHRLDSYLFESICKKQAEWQRSGLTPCPISVNLSPESLVVDHFLNSCARTCKAYGISADLFEFELNENILNENPDKLYTLVDEIHSYGFHCSLDHFGKSSIPLHLLRDLDVDTIKLDSSLFSIENNSRRSRFIIEAILKIANQMHIRTCAEGIDNESQVQYLQQAACDMIQGFYYFRPMSVEEFRKTAYMDGELRYIMTDGGRSSASTAKNTSTSNFIMFSYMPGEDRIVFSNAFSPVMDGQLEFRNASALFRRSVLIHENDRGDFFHLLNRCHNEDGWIYNTLRFYTAEGHYDWLEVYLHKDHLPGADDSIISGTLINLDRWQNEVDRWKEKANRDALTGIYNREYFEQFTANTLNGGNLSTGAVVFIDIDDFKKVNDTLGHVVGDDVLCCVAKRILGVFRHTDIVARYGGDEFVVFVNGIGRTDLEKRLEHLCGVFRFPYRNDTIEYKISGSIGAAMFPTDGKSYEDLLENADTALYAAKGRGKDQFVLYQKGMEDTVIKDKR